MRIFGLLKKASWILVLSFILTISPLLTLSHPVSGNGVTITALPATNVTTNSATLNGSIDSTEIVQFAYGLTTTYDNFVDMGVPPGTYSTNISGLSPGTTYHFAAQYWDFGTDSWVSSNDMTFATTAIAVPSIGGAWWQRPEVVTVSVTDISDSTATFSGNLTAMGSARKVKAYFRYGTTYNSVIYPPWAGGNITQAQVLQAPSEFNDNISNLSPETKYYFCAYALADGSCYGEIMTFTTGHKLDINIMGQTTSVVSSNNGQLTEPLSVTSGDGIFELNIPAGTTALDKDGNPLQNINVSVATDVPDPPPGANIIGFVYNCQPAGATFDPPLTLTMHYDPDALPDGVTEESLTIAYWDGTQWLFLEGIVDTVNHTVTVQISHFSGFALMCELPATPPPSAGPSTSSPSTAPGEENTSPSQPSSAVTPAAPSETTTAPAAATPSSPAAAPAPTTVPAPPSPEPGSFNWWWLVAIVIGVVIIGWVTFRLVRRRD